MTTTTFLIIGAGPYGLSTAAHARRLGIDVYVLGRPMAFWKEHMPQGMYLRSPVAWDLETTGKATFSLFLERQGIPESSDLPIPLDRFLAYGQWFQEQYNLVSDERYVQRLEKTPAGYTAWLEDGSGLNAKNVLLAPGFRPFRYFPEELMAQLPSDRVAHTCDLVRFFRLRRKRCLIVGGRQSAFEWAALLHEQAEAEIHISYRHDTPRFVESDWSWIDPMLETTVREPGWFRRLPLEEQDRIRHRFWEEGRQKLEPWLVSRIDTPAIRLWPRTRISKCTPSPEGALEITLNDEYHVSVDLILFATGYRVNIGNLHYLDRTSILDELQTVDDAPTLDDHFQTSLPGLFMTGLPAVRDFGPFFGFVKGCPASARLIVDALRPG